MPDADDLQRAISLLVHDLRAPLGVAQGYLRLLRDDRLTDADERAKAWEQTGEALLRIGKLCQDATAFAQDAGATVLIEVPAPDLVARVSDRLGAHVARIDHGAIGDGWVRVGQLDPLVDAVATIVTPIHARHPAMTLGFVGVDRELQGLLGTDLQRAALRAEPAAPFDPWRGGHGLALVTACRQVAAIGGRVWTTTSATPGVGIGFPLETR